MIRIFNIISLVIITIGFISCGKESSCLKSSGSLTSELRSAPGIISKIKIEDNINLFITQSSETTLRVEAGKNLLSYINTDVNEGTLKISNGNKCNFLRSYDKPVNVYLSLPNLTEIAYEGKGSVSSIGVLSFPKLTIETKNGTGNIDLNLVSDNVRLLSHSGATQFTIKGVATNLFVYTGASTWYYLSSLAASSVHVNNSGVGDVLVNANSSLLVELTSLGSIIYSGNPVVSVSVNTGEGQLIKK